MSKFFRYFAIICYVLSLLSVAVFFCCLNHLKTNYPVNPPEWVIGWVLLTFLVGLLAIISLVIYLLTDY